MQNVYLTIAVILASVLFVGGYLLGYSRQHDALVSLKAEITTQAAIQADTTKKKEIENDRNTLYVASVYASDSVRLRDVLAGLRKQPGTSASGVPISAVDPGIAGASGVQPGRVGSGFCDSTGSDPCTISRSVYESALMDAQAWEAVQGWLVSERIPGAP